MQTTKSILSSAERRYEPSFIGGRIGVSEPNVQYDWFQRVGKAIVTVHPIILMCSTALELEDDMNAMIESWTSCCGTCRGDLFRDVNLLQVPRPN